jgi:hypothetical protein
MTSRGFASFVPERAFEKRRYRVVPPVLVD